MPDKFPKKISSKNDFFFFFFFCLLLLTSMSFLFYFFNFAALKCDVIGGARRPDLYTVCRDPTRISCNQKKTPSSSTLIFNLNENGREIQIKISRDYAGVASQSAKHQRKRKMYTANKKIRRHVWGHVVFRCLLSWKVSIASKETHTHTQKKINIQLVENHSIRILLFFSFTRPISNNNVATLFSFPPTFLFFFLEFLPDRIYI